MISIGLPRPVLAGALVVVIVALPCFFIWELGERHPAIDVRLLLTATITIATICSVLGFLVIQGLLSVFVVQLQLLLGYSSSLAGLVYLSMILLSVPLVAIIHELCRKFDVRLIASLNFLGFAVILMWIGLFDKNGYFDQIALPMIFFGLSLAAFFTPLAALAMHGLPAARLIRAAEELTLLRTAAGAFGITLHGRCPVPAHALSISSISRIISAEGASLRSIYCRNSRTGCKRRGSRRIWRAAKLGSFIRQEASLLALNDAFLLGAVRFRRAGRLRLARPARPSRPQNASKSCARQKPKK